MNEIKYRITGIDPSEHQITVRFFTDDLPESELVSAWAPDGTPAAYRTDYAITLPLPAPVGADLDEYIIRRCPLHWFDLKAAIANPNVDSSMSNLTPAIGIAKTVEIPPPPEPDPREIAKAARAALVAAIKVTTAAGNEFDGDEISQGRMVRAIIALQATGTPSVTWVLANNQPIEATAAELSEALALAGAAQAAIWVIPE